DLVKIIVDDVPDELADEIEVRVSATAVNSLNELEKSLTIEAGGVTITLPQTTLQGLAAVGDDLYFRIVPVRKTEDWQTVVNRVLGNVELQQDSRDKTVDVIVQPMVLETNYESQKTRVQFPLSGLTIPTDPGERLQFLRCLVIFIENSDGEKVVKHGDV